MRHVETRDELVDGWVEGHHSRLSGRRRTRRGQAFLLIDRREHRDAASPLPRAIRRGAGTACGRAGAAAFAGGPPTEAREFFLGDTRHRIAIGFAGAEHVPGEGDKLTGGGDDGDAAILPVLEFAHEGPERAGVAIQMLSRLDQEPPHMARPLFGNVPGITVLRRLTHRRHETEIGGQPRGVGNRETSPIADRSDSIVKEGLTQFDSRVPVYLTPSGNLSALQAQTDLALRPNAGLRDAVYQIDVKTAQQLGVSFPAPTPVPRHYNMPGRGLRCQCINRFQVRQSEEYDTCHEQKRTNNVDAIHNATESRPRFRRGDICVP